MASLENGSALSKVAAVEPILLPSLSPSSNSLGCQDLWAKGRVGETAVQASCLLQGISWHHHSMGGGGELRGGTWLPGAVHPYIPFNFLLPGILTFMFKGMFLLIFQCSVLDTGDMDIGDCPARGAFIHHCPSPRPSETLDLSPSKTFLLFPLAPSRTYGPSHCLLQTSKQTFAGPHALSLFCPLI